MQREPKEETMRYRRAIGDDNVNHLIGECLRSKADAERIYDILISRKHT